jgi:hypothetical protein
MATLKDCHDALELRLKTIPGLRTFNNPPQGGTPPVAFMVLTDWSPSAMGRASLKTYRFDLYVLTATGVRSDVGYHALLEYADSSGPLSVELAIWDGNDRSASTFGGVPDTQAGVVGFRLLGQTKMDELQMYGGLFTVEIITKG